MHRKKVDNRIRILIENGVAERQRSLFVVVGDRGKDQVRPGKCFVFWLPSWLVKSLVGTFVQYLEIVNFLYLDLWLGEPVSLECRNDGLTDLKVKHVWPGFWFPSGYFLPCDLGAFQMRSWAWWSLWRLWHWDSVISLSWQVVILHHMLSKATVKARPSVLWCYKKELGFSR